MRNRIPVSKVASAILAVLCAIVPVGCDDDPVSPPPSGPPDYHVYYDYDGTAARWEFMPIYSTKTLQAVDTFDGTLDDFLFTPDGKYMVAYKAYYGEIRLIDMATRSVVAMDTGVMTHNLSLSRSGKYLLAGKRLSDFGLAVYAIDGLTRLWYDTTHGVAEFVSNGSKFVYAKPQNDTFYVVDFINAPNDRVKLNGGSGFYAITMSLDTASGRLYVIGQTTAAYYNLRIYEGDSLTPVGAFGIPLNFRTASMAFSPDGDYAYLAGPFAEGGYHPGVLRFDVASRTLEWFIDATRFVIPTLIPHSLQVTPDGATLCVLSYGTYGLDPGNLFLFGAKAGELIRVFRHYGGAGKHIRVYPIAQ